ncbi:MAG TPA: LuxR C-terminal-related transcriptional regulator, partial [Azospirillum sp.]|nr:LuxR C-terminal-related transcriptional regulator [Azospirillum sp.]
LLGITEATVKVHLKSIFRKLGVPNRSSAACAAISFGIAQPQFTPEQEIKAKNFAAKAGAEA